MVFDYSSLFSFRLLSGTFVVQLCCLSFAKIVCFLVSYLVGLISRYGIDVFKSRFHISTCYKLRNTAKRESNLT